MQVSCMCNQFLLASNLSSDLISNLSSEWFCGVQNLTKASVNILEGCQINHFWTNNQVRETVEKLILFHLSSQKLEGKCGREIAHFILLSFPFVTFINTLLLFIFSLNAGFTALHEKPQLPSIEKGAHARMSFQGKEEPKNTIQNQLLLSCT